MFMSLRYVPLAALSMLLAVLLAITSSAHAQISTATINGTVRDSTGAVVPGVEISISNVETGLEQQAASNSAGVYRFSNLQPGLYTLSCTASGCTASGFQTAVVNPFSLVVNQTATFDFLITHQPKLGGGRVGAEYARRHRRGGARDRPAGSGG